MNQEVVYNYTPNNTVGGLQMNYNYYDHRNHNIFMPNDGRPITAVNTMDRIIQNLRNLPLGNYTAIEHSMLNNVPNLTVSQALATDIYNLNLAAMQGAETIEDVVTMASDPTMDSSAVDFNRVADNTAEVLGRWLDSFEETKRRLEKKSYHLVGNSQDGTNVMLLLAHALDILQYVFVPDKEASPTEIHQRVQSIFMQLGIDPMKQPDVMDKINVITALFGDKQWNPVDTVNSMTRMISYTRALIKMAVRNQNSGYTDAVLVDSVQAMQASLSEAISKYPNANAAGYYMADEVEKNTLNVLVKLGHLRPEFADTMRRHTNGMYFANSPDNPYQDLSGTFPNGRSTMVNPNMTTFAINPDGSVYSADKNGNQVPFEVKNDSLNEFNTLYSSLYNKVYNDAIIRFNQGQGPDPVSMQGQLQEQVKGMIMQQRPDLSRFITGYAAPVYTQPVNNQTNMGQPIVNGANYGNPQFNNNNGFMPINNNQPQQVETDALGRPLPKKASVFDTMNNGQQQPLFGNNFQNNYQNGNYNPQPMMNNNQGNMGYNNYNNSVINNGFNQPQPINNGMTSGMYNPLNQMLNNQQAPSFGQPQPMMSQPVYPQGYNTQPIGYNNVNPYLNNTPHKHRSLGDIIEEMDNNYRRGQYNQPQYNNQMNGYAQPMYNQPMQPGYGYQPQPQRGYNGYNQPMMGAQPAIVPMGNQGYNGYNPQPMGMGAAQPYYNNMNGGYGVSRSVSDMPGAIPIPYVPEEQVQPQPQRGASPLSNYTMGGGISASSLGYK